MSLLYMCVNKKDGIPVILTWNIKEAEYFVKGFDYRMVILKEADYIFLRDALISLTGEKKDGN